MKVIELPCDESKFTYPEEMKKLIEKLKDKNIKLNVDLIILEKLWYVFSEKYCESFLIVDDETVSDFIYWAKDVDYEFAQKCNYCGYVEEDQKMNKIEPKSMTKTVSVFKEDAFRYGFPYRITIYDEDVRKDILNGIRSSLSIHYSSPEDLEEILARLNMSLENGVNVMFKELIANNTIAMFALVTLHRTYDICVRIDNIEAQKTADDIRMDDILKIEEFEEN